MPNKICRILMTMLLPLTFPGLAGAQTASPAPLIQITPQQASSFASAFTTLSQQGHVAIVAEDQPLSLTLSTASSPPSAQRSAAALNLKKEGEPLSALLPKLAAAYDYDVVPSGKVFLLKKRYTDAADLPSVTVKECALGLAEANRYTDNFNPHFPNNEIDDSPAMKDLIYSLTPKQLEAMKDIKRGVLVSSLTPEHQQEVQQFLLHLSVQRTVRHLPPIIDFLNRVATTDPQFRWQGYTQFSTRAFGYDTTLAGGQSLFMTLSKPDQMKTFMAGGMRISAGQQAGVFGSIPLAPGDVTDPTPVPPNAPKPAPPVSSALSDILARLNARAADGLKIPVEPYLAPKQATVFGGTAATPREEISALADLYGLRLLTEEKEKGKDRLLLTRQTAQVPLDFIAMHASLLQSLPDPLVRACRMHPTFGPFDPNSPIPSGISPLFVYAVKQLRTAAEPKIKESKDGHVALSALSEREGRTFAVTLMVDAMDDLRELTGVAVPKEFTQFNELRLSGGLYDDKGKQKMDLLLGLPNPNDPTTLLQGPGVGQINYDPVNQTL